MNSGRVLSGTRDLGSGFAIASHRVITAGHVVSGKSARDLAYLSSLGERLQIEFVKVDESIDVALLGLVDAIDASPHGCQWEAGSSWLVESQPRTNDPGLTGVVVGERKIVNAGGHAVQVIQLRVHELLAGFQGYSGSAVWTDNALIGVLVEQVHERGPSTPSLGGQHRAANVLYAVAIERVVAAFELDLPIRQRRGRQPQILTFYPGLLEFSEDQASVFFGRHREATRLREALVVAGPPAGRCVTLIGPSGVGKSSLVAAGLRANLSSDPAWSLLPTLRRPGLDPTASLANVLSQHEIYPPNAIQMEADLDSPELLSEDSPANFNPRISRREPHFILLVVDQAEEILTLASDAEQEAFRGLIERALLAEPRLRVLFVLRSDFVTNALNGGHAHLFQRPVAIGALGKKELRETISRPAEIVGLNFDPPSLIDEMVDDGIGGDSLPLLAFTLNLLVQRVGPNRTISQRDYDQIGGVIGALSRQADSAFNVLRQYFAEDVILDVLLRFVTVTGTTPTRRRVSRPALNPANQSIVDEFIRHRLLVADVDSIEVAHEAIFRCWSPLEQAIAQRIGALRQRGDLERWAHDWIRFDRSRSFLLRGERLVTASRVWLELGVEECEFPTVIEFLQASRDADYLAAQNRANEIAHQALLVTRQDPELALRLSLTAIDEHAETSRARHALTAALSRYRVGRVLEGHGDAVWSARWSPDGRFLVTASWDGTAVVWDLDGKQIIKLIGHSQWIRCVMWAPTCNLIATSSRDGTARIWDMDGSCLNVFEHNGFVHAAAWEPSGQGICTAADDGFARIWQLNDVEPTLTIAAHESPVHSVAWSPNGRWLATGSQDQTAKVWDAATGELAHVFSGHLGKIWSVAWSPDGTCLATASLDRTARLWRIAAADTSPTTTSLVLAGHSEGVWCVDWSPDGGRVATAGYDRTARIWDSVTGQERLVLTGHAERIWSVAWSPDGKSAITGSQDGTARLWDVREQVLEEQLARPHEDWISSVAWSPGDDRLATASYDRTIQILDVASNQRVHTMRGHESTVRAVSWSPDGSQLASASEDHTARIWMTSTGTTAAVLRGHDDQVTGVAWSPNALWIATSSRDRSARVWSVRDPSQVRALSDESGPIWATAWSPDSHMIATVSYDRIVRIWNIHTCALVCLQGHTDEVWSVAWSKDGRYLATAARDSTIHIWNVGDGTVINVLRGHEEAVRSVAWSPDSNRVVSGSQDQTVRTWDAIGGTELAVVGVHEGRVESVCWSADGEHLASCSNDLTVRIWKANTQSHDLTERARRRLTAMSSTIKPA